MSLSAFGATVSSLRSGRKTGYHASRVDGMFAALTTGWLLHSQTVDRVVGRWGTVYATIQKMTDFFQ